MTISFFSTNETLRRERTVRRKEMVVVSDKGLDFILFNAGDGSTEVWINQDT